MTRFRLVLVAAIVAVVGWNILHHGQKWTTYHDAKGGWTIDMPSSFRVRQERSGPEIDRWDSHRHVTFGFTVVRLGPGASGEVPTPFPLDPVDFHRSALLKPYDVRIMGIVVRHQRYRIVAFMKSYAAGDTTAFRMLRSLRFD
jgi:hypothetical protein